MVISLLVIVTLLHLIVPIHYLLFVGIRRERVMNTMLLEELRNKNKVTKVLNFPKKPGAW